MLGDTLSVPSGIMTADTTPPSVPIRISSIAGRYLVFDSEAVALLRRQQNTCGILVGTVPQQPTQNIFLGLPIELRPEEVQALVQQKAAHVVDDIAAHQAALRTHGRRAYIESLRKRKQTAHRVLAERNAQKTAETAERLGVPQSSLRQKTKQPTSAPTDELLFFDHVPEASTASKESQMDLFGVTPTTSDDLLSPDVGHEFGVAHVPEGPLARFLQGSGYYMTPGLRFGARYSVYPGDPLRYHAHYMANQYDWDQAIPILDIVEGGRLATAVKKAFLIGGQEPNNDSSAEREVTVRTYSLEWAGM